MNFHEFHPPFPHSRQTDFRDVFILPRLLEVETSLVLFAMIHDLMS